MIPKQTIQKHILFVNPFDFLGESFVTMMSSISLESELYLVSKNTVAAYVLKYSKNPQISLIDYQLFFQNPHVNTYTDLIICNALSENGQSSQLLDYSHNFRKLLELSKEHNIPLLLLLPIHAIQKNEKKFDYISSLASLAEEFSQQGGNIRIANFGEIYGPGMDLSLKTPLTNLLLELGRKDSISIEGDPAFRYYLYIDDALSGLLYTIQNKEEKEVTLSETQDISIASVALRIGEILGKKVVSNISPLASDHLKTATQTPTKWRPQTTLESGLEKTLLWIKQSQAIKNADSLDIRSVSIDPQLLAPIRNYTPAASVFRDIPEGLVEHPTTIDQHKNQGKLMDIRAIRSKAGETAEKKFSLRELYTPLSSQIIRLFSRKDRSSKQKQFYWKRYTLSLLIIFIFIPLIPFFVGIYDYIQIMHGLSVNNLPSVETNAMHLESVLPFTTWAFKVTNQTDRYSTLMQIAIGLKKGASAVQEYTTFKNNNDAFINAYTSQQPSIQNTFKGIHTNIALYSDLLIDLSTAKNILAIQSSLMPEQATSLRSNLSYDENYVRNSGKLLTVATLFSGTKKFLIVNESSTNLSFSKSDITQIYSAGFNNGIYLGLTDLALPKGTSGETLPEFAVNLEHDLSDSYDALIMVSNTFTQQATEEIPGTTNGNLVNNVIKYSMSGKRESIAGMIQKGIEDQSLAVYIYNSEITDSDL